MGKKKNRQNKSNRKSSKSKKNTVETVVVKPEVKPVTGKPSIAASTALVPVEQVEKIVETTFSKKLEEIITEGNQHTRKLFGKAVIYLQAPPKKLYQKLLDQKEQIQTFTIKSGIWILSIAIIGGGFVGLEAWANDRILPNLHLAGQNLGLQTTAAAELEITTLLNNYHRQPIVFQYQGKTIELSPLELGVKLDLPKTLAQAANFSFKENSWTLLLASAISQPSLTPVFTYDYDQLASKLESALDLTSQRAQSATFKADSAGKKVEIIPEKAGLRLSRTVLENALSQHFQALSSGAIELSTEVESPTITASELAKFQDDLMVKLQNEINFHFGEQTWKTKLINQLAYLDFQKQEDQVKILIKPEILQAAFFKEIFSKIEKPTQGVKITMDEAKKVQFTGMAVDGVTVKTTELLADLVEAANTLNTNIDFSTEVSAAPVEVSPELAALGINKLIATGHTAFAGSPANRRHNIQVAANRYNGVLIAPGETFSFNDNLGEVDGKSGYKLELVIKSTGTVPEYGGGVCQVSSTLYKGALLAGLPIVERYPHSYAVSYYAQIDGYGLDSTIYPGVKDLKFANDTPGSILLQAVVDGDHLYIKVYGTSDGRQVRLENYRRYNARSAGGTERIPTKTLPTGATKQIESAHPGFDVTWDRVIVKDGKEVVEKINSVYRATANRILVGQ